LNVRAQAAGKLYFGSATDNGELTDAPYLAELSNTADFGQITPGNSMKVFKLLATLSPCPDVVIVG
jgi:endo-1,4-beta-xylanase